MVRGPVMVGCPVSTADGVKAADVAWASPQRMTELKKLACFPSAPEICVEILSPANTDAEIQEKIRLSFDAGALEVWICALDGKMSFFEHSGAGSLQKSKLCPDFPSRIQLS